MTEPKCSKCESASFETKSIKSDDSRSTITLVNCAKCGTVIGVLDGDVDAKLNVITNFLSQIDQKLVNLQTTLRFQ